MKRVLITGSTDGVGRSTAEALIDDGHHVVAHARTTARLSAVQHLIDRGAETIVGDLGELDEVRDLVEQANSLGPFDAVIHNAGVFRGAVLPVNVTAPYLMTAGIERPGRLIYLSSSMHRGGRPDLSGVDWAGNRDDPLVLGLEAVRHHPDGRRRTDPAGRHGARGRPRLGAHPDGRSRRERQPRAGARHPGLARDHADPEALVSGRYWHHQRTEETHPAVHDEGFQDELLSSLSEQTGVALTTRTAT